MIKINHERRQISDETVKKPKTRETTMAPNIIPEHRYTLWFVALIAVVFFLFALSYLFSKAEVTVDPKIKDIVLNENLSASKDSNTGGLPFDLVVIPGEETKTVAAIEEKEISQKAKGTVLIYNAFSSVSQALNIDTRLEGSNGKIYKTETRTIVPGMAKNGTPGSVEVKIYGAEAGEEYNSAPLDFKIFGFKGTSKYSKFYARSKGEITSGFKGKTHIVSLVDKENAVTELKNILKEKLLKKATDQIPSGFVLFKKAIFLDIDDGENIELLSPNDTLPIKLKGTLYGILFEEKQLTKKIAQDTIEEYDGSEVYISNVKDLIFSPPAKEISFKDIKTLNFNLSGTAKIVWKLDVDKLATDLLSKSRKEFYQILSQYPNINSANLTLSPIWKRSIPDKIKDIKILVNYPK